MTIAVKVGDRLKKLKEEYRKQAPQRIRATTEEIAREIVERTQAGKDYTGAAFKPYTPAYAAYKSGFTLQGNRRRKTGANGKLRAVATRFGAGGAVNLTYTGRMLGSIKTKVSRVANGFLATLYIGAEHIGKARGAMFGYGKPGNNKREFFRLSKEQLEKIKENIKELITDGR